MELRMLDASLIEPDVLREVDRIIDSYDDPAGKIMMILSKVQKVNGYLPPALQLYIARRIGIPAAKINGIVSFYALFIEEPEGKYNVSVCLGTACFVKGSAEILAEVRRELGMTDGRKISEDGLFSISEVRCVGACGLAPVMRVNDKIYGHVKPEDVKGILDHYRELAAKEADKDVLHRHPELEGSALPPGVEVQNAPPAGEAHCCCEHAEAKGEKK